VTAPLPIVLDTDIGTDVDDALALALVLASPELDLRAVTTVSGDVGLRGRIAKKLLALAGCDDIPVAAGIREPVLRQRNFLWLGHEGEAIVEPSDSLPLRSTHAVDVMIDAVREHRPHVVTIGPLSNLAVAIMKEPAVIEAIPQLVMMGGTIGIYPGVLPIEYNSCSDAEASLVVLNAGIPTMMVPLDVTIQVALSASHLARLRTSGSRLVQVLCDAIDLWAPIHRQFFESQPGWDAVTVALLHDPLTVAVLIDPSFVTVERRRLRPAIIDGVFRLVADTSAPEIEVAVAVDAPRFVEFLVTRLLGLP
jgi:purine nucleosidase